MLALRKIVRVTWPSVTNIYNNIDKTERTFWLCWTVFDKMFQSEEFSHGMVGPKRVRDTIRVECALPELQPGLVLMQL